MTFGTGSFGTGTFGTGGTPSGPAGLDGAVLADSPLVYLKFDETSGDAADSSGNGRDFTVNSGTLRPGAPIVDGWAAYFPGAGSISHADDTWTSPASFSVELFFGSGINSGYHAMASHGGDSDGWAFFLNDGYFNAYLPGNGNSHLSDTVLVTGNESHQAVLTYDDATNVMALYCDGELVGTFTGTTIVQPSEPLVIGDTAGGGFHFVGAIDAYSYYDTALDSTRVAAHFAEWTPPPGDPQNIDVPLVQEYDDAFEVLGTRVGDVLVPLVEEFDDALSVEVLQPIFQDVPLVEEEDVALGLFTGPPVIGFVAKVDESEEALGIIPLTQRTGSALPAQEHEIALPIAARLLQTGVGFETGGHLAVAVGIAYELEAAFHVSSNLDVLVPITAGSGFSGSWHGPNGDVSYPNALTLDLLEREVVRAPTSILVNVSGAVPNRNITFLIDGVEAWDALMLSSDGSAMFSVPVSEENGRRGEHVMTVQQTGAQSDERIFTVVYAPDAIPTERGPDARPVEIPESIHPSGIRRWVLQDLMPAGLGSYVMPLNPQTMDNPAFERVLATKSTTAVDGQPHVYEGGVRPLEWSFSGYCPTEEMAETLRAYGDLKRRFYVIDHRGRAWVFVCTQATLTPRLQQNNIYGDLTDWVHDYQISGVIFDRAEFA